jgi:hypothetical protein
MRKLCLDIKKQRWTGTHEIESREQQGETERDIDKPESKAAFRLGLLGVFGRLWRDFVLV